MQRKEMITPMTQFDDLPQDIIRYLAGFMTAVEVGRLRRVNRTFYRALGDNNIETSIKILGKQYPINLGNAPSVVIEINQHESNKKSLQERYRYLVNSKPYIVGVSLSFIMVGIVLLVYGIAALDKTSHYAGLGCLFGGTALALYLTNVNTRKTIKLVVDSETHELEEAALKAYVNEKSNLHLKLS